MAIRVSVVCDKDHFYHGALKNIACVDMYRGDIEVLELSEQIKQEKAGLSLTLPALLQQEPQHEIYAVVSGVYFLFLIRL